MLLSEAIDQFLDYLSFQKRSSQHTIKAYKNDLYSFRDDLVHQMEIERLEHITARIIGSHVARLAETGLAARTLNRKISAIQSLFKYCQKHEWIKKNPAGNIKRPKVPKRLPEVAKADDLTRLLEGDFFMDDFSGKRDRLLLMLLYAAGLRRDELIHIRLVDINRSEGTVKVTGKRNKQRVVPLARTVLDVISDYEAERVQLEPEEDYLLVTDKGKKLYPGLVYKKVKNYLSLITTMQKKSPHVLRHSFATHLLNEGSNLQAIKELLGHSSLAATQVYTQTSLEKLKDVYNKAHPKSLKS